MIVPSPNTLNAGATQRGTGDGTSANPVERGVVSGRDLLRHAHPPSVGDKLTQLVLVDRGQPDLHPVVALVRPLGHEELVRVAGHQCGPLLFGEAESHDRLVARQRHVDDPADPELHPIPDQVLGAARQIPGDPANILNGDHESTVAARYDKTLALPRVTGGAPGTIRTRSRPPPSTSPPTAAASTGRWP